MIQNFLSSLQPDQNRLFYEISKHVTDDMLEEIAAADYGDGQDVHLVALRRLRDIGTFVEPMHWYPCEVLELIRNSEPADPAWKPGSTGIRGHWMRAFASAALLRALGPPCEYSADPATPSYTLIQLINSLRALPVDFTLDSVRFVAWLMSASNLESKDVQVVYFGIGLLWLTLHLQEPPADRDLVDLADWIVRREAELARALPGGFDRWLFGILGTDAPPSPWERLGVDLCSLDLSGRQKQLQEWVTLIGTELAPVP